MKKVNNWSDITISQFIELSQLPKDSEDLNFQSFGVIYDIGQDEIDELSYDEFNDLQLKLNFMSRLPTQLVGNIQIKTTQLVLIEDLVKLSLGEWIDIENLLPDLINNLPVIAAILYRKQILGDDFNPDVFEPYGQYIHHRSALFNESSMADIYGIIPHVLKFRTMIHTNYSGLFNNLEGEETNEVEDEDEDFIESSIEKKERLDEEKTAKYKSKWGWDTVVYSLAKGDITKFEAIYAMPLVMVLNFMSMKYELKLE